MSGDDDSVTIWYQRDRYAIGREGYRPFVSMPEDMAKRAQTGTVTAERLSVAILFISGLIIGLQVLGVPIPITIDAILFILEISMVSFASSVFAKTVIKKETITSTHPTRAKIEGQASEQSIFSEHPTLTIRAQVQESQLRVSVRYVRRVSTDVWLKEAWSDSGDLEIQGIGDNEMDSTSYRIQGMTGSVEFVHEVVGLTTETDFDDTLHLVFATSTTPGTNTQPDGEAALSIPVTVLAEGQIESEQVIETVSFERLTD